MLGVVVSTTLPRPDTPLVVIIFVDKDLPLYYTKNVNRSVQTRMSKEERKRMDKVPTHLIFERFYTFKLSLRMTLKLYFCH